MRAFLNRIRSLEMWSVPTLESIAQDVRYGARQLRAAPVFTSVAVLSMAAGLTAGLAVFTFMNAVILRPLGFGEGARICGSCRRPEERGMNRYCSRPLPRIIFV